MPSVVVATAFGGPEVLSVVDQPTGTPGPGEALVEIRAVGVNPIDWKMYSGAFGSDPSTLPRRVGFEGAGVVTAVGEGAAGPAGPISVGDEVIAFRAQGTYAAEVILKGGALVPKPAELRFEQAAGLMLAGTTAVHLLTAAAVTAGDTVLIHAAAGGVGRFAVQLAVAEGARVIGTASQSGHDDLRSLGAEPVAYGEGLADRVRALAPDGIDAALDCIGSDEALDVSLELVADRDRIASIAAFARGGEAGIKLLGNGPGADPGTELRDNARLRLTELAAAGKLDLVTEAFPLADVADVHRRGMEGHTRGKVVLVP